MKSPANEYADRLNMAPISEPNELIEYFKKQVDREALRENLKLTPAQRMEKLERTLRQKYADRFPPRPEPSPKPLREEPPRYGDEEPNASNDLVEALKKDVDRTLLTENLKLTVPQRMAKFEENMRMIYNLRRGLRRARQNAANEQ